MSQNLAIFVIPFIGAVIATVLESIWYGPLFSKSYMKAMGVDPMLAGTEEAKKSMMISVVLELLMNFVLFFGFFTILGIAGAVTYISSLIFAAIFWFFMVMPLKASAAIWSDKSTTSKWVLFGLGSGISLLSFVVVSPMFIWLVNFIK